MNKAPTTDQKAIILDSDEAHSRTLSDLLVEAGWQPLVLKSPAELTQASPPLIAFVALEQSDLTSILESPQLEECSEIFLMAADDNPRQVRRGIAAGATYFFEKPLDAAFIRQLLQDIEAEQSATSSVATDSSVPTLDQFGHLRGSSPQMRKLFRVLRKVAPTDASVLVVGESGTGKELVATTLHELSNRNDGPFVAMNCGAVAAELFESELFGHEKGSFSGAIRRHIGFYERAHGGTLFLDELTEMPLELQVKLLRLLELGQFRRVGGEEDLKADVRVVAATNRDPEMAVTAGLLREDLYFRIAGFPIHLPPLRRRRGDATGLASFFLTELNRQSSKQKTFSPAALAAISEHPWPGNVRQLQSALEQAYILADQQILQEHLPLDESTDTAEPTYPTETKLAESGSSQIVVNVGETIKSAEQKLITATIDALQGDKKAAASMLGISVKTLYNRLKTYDLL